MHNKSLNQVGNEASDHYYQHKQAANSLERHTHALETVQNGGWLDNAKGETQEDAVKLNTKLLDDVTRLVDSAKMSYQESVTEGKKFAQDNAEQLHDLALIEAHLGGVAIKVEQPLVIGQTTKPPKQ